MIRDGLKGMKGLEGMDFAETGKDAMVVPLSEAGLFHLAATGRMEKDLRFEI